MAASDAQRRVIVFDLCTNEVFSGVREVNLALLNYCKLPDHPGLDDKSPEEDKEREREPSLVKEVSEKMFCSACRCPFSNREEQMEHYKLDWHRFNLRQKMSGATPVTADEFERKTGAGDVSSISGSESDSSREDSASDSGEAGSNNKDTDSSLITVRPSSKVVFQNSAGQYLSVHRCILQGKAKQSDVEEDATSSLRAINKNTVWVILMTGGGHFAGAVFQGKEVLQHKTFHRYTVRAKRGTAQGLRDSQNHSHTPKSAGAALRRYNEAALVKDIQDLLEKWAQHLREASAVYVRAPSYNKTIFFSGRAAPLDRKDGRIRSVPFPTRRATFQEVQRVHEVLSTVHIYEKDADLSAVFSPSKKVWKKTIKNLPQAKTEPEIDTAQEKRISSDEEEGGEVQLELVEQTLGTLDLREFEVCPSRHRRRRRKKEEIAKQNDKLSDVEAESGKEEEEAPEAAAIENTTQRTRSKKKKGHSKKELKESVEESWDYGLRDALFTACKVGDVDTLHSLLQPPGDSAESSDPSGTTSALTLLCKPIDLSGFTLLHVASAAAQKGAVSLLLDAGSDPACRDKKGQTPYIVAPDKDTRNVFRKYMGENPDRYDYKKAQVPGPLSEEIESKQLAKKKAQNALKKQREKKQREEKRQQELEAEEKRRFASLSDREKRALAAEKRLAQQVASAEVSLSNIKRCWTCGESLVGKVPFQYLDYSFCTPRCVQAHRKASAPPGKS